MIDYGLSFFQSLIFMKFIYLRIRYKRRPKPLARLDLLVVGGVPEHVESKVCTICL